jgi:hypothetical protein
MVESDSGSLESVSSQDISVQAKLANEEDWVVLRLQLELSRRLKESCVG